MDSFPGSVVVVWRESLFAWWGRVSAPPGVAPIPRGSLRLACGVNDFWFDYHFITNGATPELMGER